MQEQMLGGKGFLVIGYLLEKVSDMYWWFYCVAFIVGQMKISNCIFCNFPFHWLYGGHTVCLLKNIFILWLKYKCRYGIIMGVTEVNNENF
jgi:hypothetical protein